MKPVFPLLFLVCALSAYAQEKNYTISPALDIRQRGWNKVLCMKNGNTLLFHMEPAKRIEVCVFDSTHRLVASRKDATRFLDYFLIEYVTFKGLFEINGEAVLFLDQDRNGKHSLIMLRYNAATGAVTDERLVGESKSENRRISYYVMKNKHEDSYEILFCMDKRHPRQSDIFMVYFNSRHESMREVKLDLARKKYDYLQVLGAESEPNGVLVTLGLDKTITYGGAADLNRTLFAKPDHDSALLMGGSVFQHYFSYYYIPNDTSAMKTGLVELSETIFPYFTLYTYNPFADKLNLLLFSYKPLYYQFGLNELLGSVSDNLLFSIDRYDMSAKLNMVRSSIYDLAIEYKDTGAPYQGMPLKMFTNENGLSTIISQSYTRYGEPETRSRYNYQDYFNNIGITQFDDVGKEIWSAVLPLAQYYKSYQGYLDEKNLAKRWQDQVIFGDLPEQVYNRQFVSFNAYTNNKTFYIVYNDCIKNFSNSLSKRSDTVYNFEHTNACYYKVNRMKEISRHYLLGQPPPRESRCSFIEGAGFDEDRGVYATLVQVKKHDNITLHMAWSLLE